MSGSRTSTRRILAAVAAASLAAVVGGVAYAQHFDASRPRTFVVGPRHGGSPGDRVDWGRSGLARSPLPTHGLVVQWRRGLGPAIESAPVVDEAGAISVLVGRGDVVTLSADGAERARAITGAPQGGPLALLSDGTVVFVSATGEAVGVKRGVVRFRTRIGHSDTAATPFAPIALEDGGAVVATLLDLAVIDADGEVRARASLKEALGAPLVSAQGKVIAVAASGTVYAWSLGGEPVRIGGFGGPIDAAAGLADDHTLVAVSANGQRFDALDLVRGVTVTRASAPLGFFLGPPAMNGETAHLIAYTDTNSFAITLDATGHELSRAILASTPMQLSPDGGTTALAIPPHAGVLVDLAGSTAFMAPDGSVGVVSPNGGVDTLGEFLCATNATTSTTRGQIANLVPAGQGSFLVACAGGTLAKVSAAKQL